mmetsp:Transcript_31465/g.46090  ORF Transcript_31465/g.46090 Transcript_31465/m.46090 type:complete len:261 (-) Transcript_31465:397-1179(-)
MKSMFSKNKQEPSYGTEPQSLQQKGQEILDSKAAQWGKWELERLKALAKDHSGESYSVKTLSFAAGVAMVASGVTGFIEQISSFSLMHAMVEIYVTAFGIVALVVDANEVLCPPRRRQAIFFYAQFLGTLWGKGLYFLFCGTLMVAQWSGMELAVGLYVAVLGGYMLWSGHKTQKKLTNLKAQLENEDVLKKKFKEFDKDRSGSLDDDELVQLCKSLGSDLTKAELESAILLMDRDHSGKIELQEFLYWWTGGSSADQQA